MFPSLPHVFRPLLAPCFLFIALLLNSCVEGEEEVWIEPDGSGRLVARYSVPPIALRDLGNPDDFVAMLHKIDAREESIEISELSFVTKDGKAVLKLEASFTDARELLDLAARNADIIMGDEGAPPEQVEQMAGSVNFKMDGFTPTFNRSVGLEGLIPKSVKGLLGRSNFKYTMHLPAKVKETNAHEISNEGRTLSWTFLLKDHLDSPMEMAFTTALPIPWWAWLALAIFVFIIAGLIWRKLRQSQS